MRILLVEDDRILGDGIRAGLAQDGHTVDWVPDAEQADHGLRFEEFDLVILDLGLPGMGGLALLRQIRSKGNDIPVLILTARDTVADRIEGLDHGADDYMIKPFDLEELGARARALMRRSKGRSSPKIIIGKLSLDPATHIAEYSGDRVDLSPREYATLEILMENAGRIVSRTSLQEHLYGWDKEIESNAVEVHIHHLRKKLDSALIRTVRGVGYILENNA